MTEITANSRCLSPVPLNQAVYELAKVTLNAEMKPTMDDKWKIDRARCEIRLSLSAGSMIAEGTYRKGMWVTSKREFRPADLQQNEPMIVDGDCLRSEVGDPERVIFTKFTWRNIPISFWEKYSNAIDFDKSSVAVHDYLLMVRVPLDCRQAVPLGGMLSEIRVSWGVRDASQTHDVETHSGMPGAPNTKHLYMNEFERRAKSDELLDGVCKEAKHLHKWLLTNYPKNAPGDCRSIENAIRDKYKIYQKTHNPGA